MPIVTYSNTVTDYYNLGVASQLRDIDWITASELAQDGLTYSGSTTEVNVKDSPYNAVGDGVANDTAAIQSAINSGAAVIRFPVGTYKINSTLTVASGKRLIGMGQMGQTKIIIGSLGLGDAVLTNANIPGSPGTYTDQNIRLENLVFDGANVVSRTESLLRFVQVRNLYIIKCAIQNHSRNGINLLACDQVKIWGSKFYNCGIPVGFPGPGGTPSTPALYVGEYGSGNNSSNISVMKSVFRANNHSAMYFSPSVGSITTCTIVDNGESGILSDNKSSGIQIKNNVIYRQRRVNSEASGIEVDGTGYTIQDNLIYLCGNNGIKAVNLSTSTIQANNLVNNGVENSFGAFANASGLYLNVKDSYNGQSLDMTNLTINLNRSYDTGVGTQKYGIFATKDGTKVITTSTISNNNNYGNTVGTIVDNNSSLDPSVVQSGNIANSGDQTAGTTTSPFINKVFNAGAIDYQVNLTLGFGIGYRISSGALKAARPTVQITRDLEGISYPWNSSATNTLILGIVAPSSWTTIPGKAGRIQKVTLLNKGTGELVIQAPLFTNLSTQAEALYTGTTYTSPPWTIPAGQSKEFGLRFYSDQIGTFSESMRFQTNEAASIARHDFTVVASSLYEFAITPSSTSTSTIVPGAQYIQTYKLAAYRDEIIDETADINFTATISGSIGWTIDAYRRNEVDVRFNSWIIGNNTGTYVSNLVVSSVDSPGVTITAVNTATHDPNWALNYNSSTWFSGLTLPDAFVGARIDYVNGQRTLSLGVGSGVELSPSLNNTATWFKRHFLDPIQGRGLLPHPYWQTVYSIPLLGTTTSRTYVSDAVNTVTNTYLYKNKTQEPLGKDYSWYFGQWEGQHSLFVVEEIGDGVNPNNTVVNIKLNDIREYSGNSTLDLTLERLSRVFYYYSIKDITSRENVNTTTPGGGTVTAQNVLVKNPGQAETVISSPRYDEFYRIDPTGTNTEFFYGFDSNNRVITTLRPSPT